MTNKPHSCNDPNCPAPSHDYPDGVEPAPSPQGPAPTVAGECAHCDNTELSGSCGCCGQPCCNRCSASLRAAPTPRRPAREVAEEVFNDLWRFFALPSVREQLLTRFAAMLEADRLAPVQGEARLLEAEALLRELAAPCHPLSTALAEAGCGCWLCRVRVFLGPATQPPAPPVGTGGTKGTP